MRKPIVQVAAALLVAAACFAAADARLIDAVKRRDSRMVATLIEQGAAVSDQLADGSTALAWAVYGDDKRVAQMLLKAGAAVTVNVANDYGETPLTLACLTGDGEMVEELLAAGADAKASRSTGETALMIAAGSGSLRAVDSLIKHGADINAAESSQGQTALMWAAAEKHPLHRRGFLKAVGAVAGVVVAAINIGTHASRVTLAEMEKTFLPELEAAANELGSSLMA
jgi:ankyrin repeat protein